MAENKQVAVDDSFLRELEATALDKLFSYLSTFKKFQPAIRSILKGRYSPEEMLEAEGKRCVISVTGLRYHEVIVYFQITGLSIVEVEPYENFDTFISAPLSVVNQFLARVLSGDENAFGDLAAGNNVKFRGKKTFYDLSAFQEIATTLAKNIKRLRSPT